MGTGLPTRSCATQKRTSNRERPGRGASRPGRWRSLGGLETVSYLSSKRSFPRDFADCFNCFVALRILAGLPVRCPAKRLNQLIFSGRQAVHATTLEEIGELLAGIEHAGLHRRLGNA